jgi:5-methylcytosine-specific restriction enzyme A
MTAHTAHGALHGSAWWQRRRKLQLQQQPLCAYCLRKGLVVRATVADHVTPHRGDLTAFRSGELQSLCQHHHDSTKKEQEQRGYSTAIGLDGLPIDPAHPFNSGRLGKPMTKPAKPSIKFYR